MSKKATNVSDVKKFTDIPNIGEAIARDFVLLGIKNPSDLKRCDGYQLYVKLCQLTAERHDPCVLDTFLAAVDFMQGAPAKPWWHYTAERKRLYPNI